MNNTKSGFTLLEIMVAVFLFAALTAFVAGFAVYYFQSYSFSFEENQAISTTQGALTRIIKEIREARTGENGAYPIEAADDNSIVFYADVTDDGRSDRVRYFISGTQLQRGVIEPTQAPVSYPSENEKITVVSDYINLGTQTLFTYYNGNWPSDTTNNPLISSQRLLNTRLVSVYIRINIQNNYAAAPYETSSMVQIRSLKNNL